MAKKIDKKKSDRIKDEVKKRKDRKKVIDVDEEEKIKLVIFSLLNDYYAFYCSDVKEILHTVKVTYVPGSNDFIIGVINVRGDIESVLDIYKLMAFPSTENTPDSRFIIAEKEEIRSGILVDSVVDVIDLPQSSIKPSISTIRKSVKEFIIGQTSYKNKNVTLLDIGKIFQKIQV